MKRNVERNIPTVLQMHVTCNDCSTLCVVIRQAGTVLSSSDHPLMAAMATFVGPTNQDALIPNIQHPGKTPVYACCVSHQIIWARVVVWQRNDSWEEKTCLLQ